MKYLLVIFFILMVVSIATAQEPIKVAVIDTGFNRGVLKNEPVLCQDGHKDFTDDNDPFKDSSGHGTHVSGTIRNYAGRADYCIVVIKYWARNSPDSRTDRRFVDSINWAIEQRVDIINISGGGQSKLAGEEMLIDKAQSENILFIVAAGNDNSDLNMRPYYPACYNEKMVVVGGLNTSGERLKSSNYIMSHGRCRAKRVFKELGEDVTVEMKDGRKVTLSGTSQATAIFTGKFLKRVNEYVRGTK